jgi:prophage DNA circulation protein
MMKFRYRNQTNSWPGFVDLFSNLVIILIFLLIMFVFLWTTTSVFNKTTGAKAVAELKETNAIQAEQIQEMTAYKQEANRLLILARDKLENLSQDNAALSSELNQMDVSIEDLITAYEHKITDLQNSVNRLTNQLNQTTLDKEKTSELEQQRRDLQSEMDTERAILAEQLAALQAALDAAEEKSTQQEIKYIEMSSRLNKALADKVAELKDVSKYQKMFKESLKHCSQREKEYYSKEQTEFLLNNY